MTDYVHVNMFKPAQFERHGVGPDGVTNHVHYRPHVCVQCHAMVMPLDFDEHIQWHRGVEAALLEACGRA